MCMLNLSTKLKTGLKDYKYLYVYIYLESHTYGKALSFPYVSINCIAQWSFTGTCKSF